MQDNDTETLNSGNSRVIHRRVITTVEIAEKGRTLKALFAKNKGDISCKLLSEITFSGRFCSLPELLPDTYLRDASR